MLLHLMKSTSSRTGTFCVIAFSLRFLSLVSKTTFRCKFGVAVDADVFVGGGLGIAAASWVEWIFDKLVTVNRILSSLFRCSLVDEAVADPVAADDDDVDDDVEQSNSLVNVIELRNEPLVVAHLTAVPTFFKNKSAFWARRDVFVGVSYTLPPPPPPLLTSPLANPSNSLSTTVGTMTWYNGYVSVNCFISRRKSM